MMSRGDEGRLPRSGLFVRTVESQRIHAAARPRRLWLLATLPLLLGLVWWWLHPHRLVDTELAGQRGPGCVRIVVAADASGSMAALAGPRNAAVSQLLEWVPGNLRADDELAMVVFAADAQVTMPPTKVGDVARPGHSQVDANSTILEPLAAALTELPSTTCRTSLLILGDGLFEDLPHDADEARHQLRRAGIDSISLLVPGRTEVATDWSRLYPYAKPEFFDGTDPDETALVIARTLADVTEQRLQRSTNNS